MLRKLSSGDKVCKTLYASRQAGRQWHTKLSSTLKWLELTQTTFDSCIYVDRRYRVSTYVLIYVDDIELASKDLKRVLEIKTRFSSEYQVKDLGNIKYCLGIEVEQKKNHIFIAPHTIFYKAFRDVKDGLWCLENDYCWKMKFWNLPLCRKFHRASFSFLQKFYPLLFLKKRLKTEFFKEENLINIFTSSHS